MEELAVEVDPLAPRLVIVHPLFACSPGSSTRRLRAEPDETLIVTCNAFETQEPYHVDRSDPTNVPYPG